MTIKTGASVGASKASDDEAYEAAIATLRKAAAGGNAKAKKMLQAEVADDEPDGDEAPAKKDEAAAPAAAPAAAAPPEKEPDGDEKSAKATAAQALAEAKTGRREAMLAARPDITPELRATLETLEPDAVKSILAATPRTTPKLGSAAASAVVSATRGDSQTGERASASPPDVKAQIDAAMGIKSKPVEPTFSNGVQTFPAMTRGEGVAWIKKEETRRNAEIAEQK